MGLRRAVAFSACDVIDFASEKYGSLHMHIRKPKESVDIHHYKVGIGIILAHDDDGDENLFDLEFLKAA